MSRRLCKHCGQAIHASRLAARPRTTVCQRRCPARNRKPRGSRFSREQVLACRARIKSCQQLADMLGCHPSSASRLNKKFGGEPFTRAHTAEGNEGDGPAPQPTAEAEGPAKPPKKKRGGRPKKHSDGFPEGDWRKYRVPLADQPPVQHIDPALYVEQRAAGALGLTAEEYQKHRTTK